MKTPFILALSIFSLIIGIFLFPFFSVEQAAEAVSNLICYFTIVVSDLSKAIPIGGEGEAHGGTSSSIQNYQIVTSFMEGNPIDKKRKAQVVLEPIEFPEHRTRNDFIEIPPSPQAEGGTTVPTSKVGAPSSSGAPTTSFEMDFADIDPDIADRGKKVKDRFEKLSYLSHPSRSNVKIGFVENSEFFMKELQNDMRQPPHISEQLLKKKEDILQYCEREFVLKEELTLLLFHNRENKSIEKYRFQSREETRNAVDEFLSNKYVKTLSGSPSKVGLKDLQNEFRLLCLLGKMHTLYKELERYFRGED